MSQNIVYGVAFNSLVTSDEAKYKETIQFYHRLGFSTIKIYDKFKNGQNAILSSGTAQDSSKETWLESFKLAQLDSKGFRMPQQESNGVQSDGALVKLRLVTEHVEPQNTIVTYFSTAVSEITSVLAEFGPQVEGDLVSVVDPLGNKLQFSPFPTPFVDSKITPDFYLNGPDSPVSSNLTSVANSSVDLSALTKEIKKKKIAIMTSGGDSQGMCAFVRACVRTALYYGADAYCVYEGYSGLLKGGDLLKKMSWEDVRGWLSEGGTLIGTARCLEFKERWARKQAAFNLISQGIDALIVCGGDGSLTGADLFRSEWPSLVEELVADGKFSAEQVAPYRNLSIVGAVGSIDNDMSGTDATIGAYSALERICEMVDYIDATAKSHSRAFVVEVMGRHCGWLALMAGIATGADYVFIPERAAKAGKWQDELKEICQRHRSKGRRNNTVIVAEGALDDELQPITAEHVKKVLVELGLDTRVTQLGHVQRGGTANAFDRWLATLQGVDAVRAVFESTPETPSPLIGILENKIIRIPLVESVRLTKQVAAAIEAKDFDKAISLRDTEFIEDYHNFMDTAVYDDGSKILPEEQRLNIAIVHVGAPSAALNQATRAATLYCLSRGHKTFAIQNGFSGLIQHGAVKELNWLDVENWHNLGGSEIGTNRSVPSEDLGAVAYQFQKHKFDGLIIMGGFEGFRALNELRDARVQYPIFNMPITMIPATVSNNVPGTEYSLGADTCLNALVNYTDAVKQSASASRRRVFVVEVQGGHSGYIASFTGLVTGAVAVYTPEDKITLSTIQEDLRLLKENFKKDQGENRSGKLIIRNEAASSIYTTELIADIIAESSKDRFGVRTAIPGHVQQGGVPTSKDRVTASRFAVKCVKFIEQWNAKNQAKGDLDAVLRFEYKGGVKQYTVEDEDSSAAVICINGSQISFKPINELWGNATNLQLRKGHEVHWKEFNEIGDMLSGRLMLQRAEAQE